ncbi:MAG: peptidoglycan-binding protein, partial [Clostridia bacterium]|nr:peptidoglycan-binding protein [Clostridia bacterium]
EGLSQWGTVPLAEQGLTPYEILQNFYGEDINIEFNAPTAPALGSYPGTPLQRGSGGNPVRTIQLRLNRISNNYPRIPKIYPVDGDFGPSTEEAVRVFQEVFGLTPDGIVGKQTWYRIAYLYTAITRLAELDSEGIPLDVALDTLPQNLSIGMTGQNIRLLQYLLAVIGYYYDTVPQIYITETFDADTLAAVRAVQTLLGLTPDGIVGPATWEGIGRLYQGIIDTMPEWVRDAQYPLLTERLMEGMSGEQVALLQAWLTELSAAIPQIPAVPVTAYFGTQTGAAVEAAQQYFGQTPTGVVGPILWSTLAREVQKIRGST